MYYGNCFCGFCVRERQRRRDRAEAYQLWQRAIIAWRKAMEKAAEANALVDSLSNLEVQAWGLYSAFADNET